MRIEPTPEQQALMRDAIAGGRVLSEEEAVKEALALWEERERARAEILAAVDAADAELAQGLGRVITAESMCDLAESVKQRGRKRLEAE